MSSVHCFHSAAKYLSELTGKSMMVEKYLPGWEATRYTTKGGKSKSHYSIYDLFVELNGRRYFKPRTSTRKGSVTVWTVADYPTDYVEGIGVVPDIDLPIETAWDKVGVMLYRPLEDYGFAMKRIGQYRDSLGQGWYTMTELYQVGDIQVAPNMECAHR